MSQHYSRGELTVTVTEDEIREDFNNALEKARRKGLRVSIYKAPDHLEHSVPAPFVTFESSTSYSREYGYEAGLALLDDVLSDNL